MKYWIFFYFIGGRKGEKVRAAGPWVEPCGLKSVIGIRG